MLKQIKDNLECECKVLGNGKRNVILGTIPIGEGLGKIKGKKMKESVMLLEERFRWSESLLR